MSADLIHDSDIAMVNGASAALAISDIPWAGPIACVRVGREFLPIAADGMLLGGAWPSPPPCEAIARCTRPDRSAAK